jgi:DNA-binding XRE family transcriptional regulator
MKTRFYKPRTTTPEEKAINIAVGKNLKNARINRVVCQYNIDPNGNKNAYYIKKFCTQTEMANALKIAFQQIGKYEKGQNGLSAFRLMQVSKFLNVPVEQLLEFEGQAVSPSDNPKLPLLVTGMN